MNKKLIYNLVSLSLTTLLLILTVFSWYVSNREVKATGISARTVEQTPIVKRITIYSFKGRTNNVFEVDDDPEMDGNQFVMGYNPNYELDSTVKPSLKLFEIEFVDAGVDLTNLYISTSANKFIGYGNENNWPTAEQINYGLSISSVIKYKILLANQVSINDAKTEVTFNGYSDYEYDKYIFDNTTGNIQNSYNDILPSNQLGIHKIYILLDFDEDSLERLFSLNINNPAMEAILYDDTKTLTFICDFKFLLIGKEVEA